MAAVSRAFHETSPRAGLVLGIVPGTVHELEALEDRSAAAAEHETPHGYPNPWVEVAIHTHLPDSGERGTLRSSRNHLNVLSADAIVALPGSAGTESEVWLALRYGVPIVAFGDYRGAPPHGIDLAPSLDALMDMLARAQR
jgi:predicted Rossmann-fold nucleotide-binding protein